MIAFNSIFYETASWNIKKVAKRDKKNQLNSVRLWRRSEEKGSYFVGRKKEWNSYRSKRSLSNDGFLGNFMQLTNWMGF